MNNHLVIFSSQGERLRWRPAREKWHSGKKRGEKKIHSGAQAKCLLGNFFLGPKINILFALWEEVHERILTMERGSSACEPGSTLGWRDQHLRSFTFRNGEHILSKAEESHMPVVGKLGGIQDTNTDLRSYCTDQVSLTEDICFFPWQFLQYLLTSLL